MFGVRRRLSVYRNDRPPIFQSFCLLGAQIEHRLYGKAVASPYLFPRPRTAIIRNLRRFVHRPANAVSRIVANDPVTELLRVLLNRPTDVPDTLVRMAFLDPKFQAFIGHADQLLKFFADLTNGNGSSGIADETLVSGCHVERSDV